MFYDPSGKWILPTGVVREFDWTPRVDGEALPSWLTLRGTSAIQTVNGFDGDRGFARFQTKSATPTIGDEAGVTFTPAVDSSKFREIGIFVYGWAIDTNTVTIVSQVLRHSDASTGAQFFANHSNQTSTLAVRPSTSTFSFWHLGVNNNGIRRKNVGLVVRPASREVFVTCGDPVEGAGVVWYDAGNYVNTTVAPEVFIVTQSAAQRYMEFSRIKFRFVST